jgi:hypothetical protein
MKNSWYPSPPPPQSPLRCPIWSFLIHVHFQRWTPSSQMLYVHYLKSCNYLLFVLFSFYFTFHVAISYIILFENFIFHLRLVSFLGVFRKSTVRSSICCTFRKPTQVLTPELSRCTTIPNRIYTHSDTPIPAPCPLFILRIHVHGGSRTTPASRPGVVGDVGISAYGKARLTGACTEPIAYNYFRAMISISA